MREPTTDEIGSALLADPMPEPDRALSFWPTPQTVADDLVYWLLEPWHALGDGVRVLEPSAGEGHLARAVRRHLPNAHIVGVEPSPRRAAALRESGVVDEVVERTLEDYLIMVATAARMERWLPFDLAVMNPPFTLPARPEAWAEHILAIHDDPYLLAPGALIGAVVPRIVMTGKSRLVRTVRGLVGVGGVEECERSAFSSVGAQVSTALMRVQKPC